MREFGYKLDDALALGYFSAYRLWTILDELKARDIQSNLMISDHPHTEKDKREEVWSWVKSRQPRSMMKSEPIPTEVLEKFAEAFNGR